MSIIKRFIKKFLNVVVVLVLFLNINVTPIKAESDYTEDDIFYSIGSFINSTMDGISTRLNEIEIINLGKNYAKSLIDNGSRMSDIVRIRGNEFLFNPYGKSGLDNAVDSVYGAYNDFANYAVSKVEDERYIVNINETYTYKDVGGSEGKAIGSMVYWGNPNDHVSIESINYHKVNEEKIRSYTHYSLYVESNLLNNQFYEYYRWKRHGSDKTTYGSTGSGVYTSSIPTEYYGVGAGIKYMEVSRSKLLTMTFHRVVFHNDGYVPEEDVVPYNIDDIPTKEDFVSKIEGTYEPGKFYSYNMDDLISRDTIINGDYVTNNYLTVEKYIGDSEYDDSGSGGGKDYTTILDKILSAIKELPSDEPIDNTSVLDKILSAIKDLPKDIAKKLDFPEGSGEEGGGFWSGLFGVIGDLATSVSDLITGLPNAIIDLLDGLLGLVEKVVELFVPSAEQVEELKGSLDLLVGDLTGKFDFVLEPINQIKTVYSKPQSIYDLKIEYDGQDFYVVPYFLKSSLDKLKVLLNGSVVLFTLISIYKRFVGREDVIK